jgi:hypothetical protein
MVAILKVKNDNRVDAGTHPLCQRTHTHSQHSEIVRPGYDIRWQSFAPTEFLYGPGRLYKEKPIIQKRIIKLLLPELSKFLLVPAFYSIWYTYGIRYNSNFCSYLSTINIPLMRISACVGVINLAA